MNGPKSSTSLDIPINTKLHPAVIQAGLWFNRGVVTGSNDRCRVTLEALKEVCVLFASFMLAGGVAAGWCLSAQLALLSGGVAVKVHSMNSLSRLATRWPFLPLWVEPSAVKAHRSPIPLAHMLLTGRFTSRPPYVVL